MLGEIVKHRPVADRGLDSRQDQQALDLGGEGQAIPDLPIKERLDAQAVPGQKQLPLPPVPDGQGKHAVEMPDDLRTPGLVTVDDDLGVGGSSENMPLLL